MRQTITTTSQYRSVAETAVQMNEDALRAEGWIIMSRSDIRLTKGMYVFKTEIAGDYDQVIKARLSAQAQQPTTCAKRKAGSRIAQIANSFDLELDL